MSLRTLTATLLLFGFLASGCQHSPHKNYVLLNLPAPAVQKNTSVNITQIIGIGPIEIADYLDRSAIVYTQSDNTLTVSDNDLWGEPLTKGIARVLADTLTQKNSSRSFVQYPWRSDSKPELSLRVHVNNLNRKDNEASIDATWELINNNTKTLLQRQHFTSATSATQGTTGTAQAYSKLLGELATEIDSGLQQSVANTPK